jgi:hypothetical protein
VKADEFVILFLAMRRLVEQIEISLLEVHLITSDTIDPWYG